LFVVGIKTVDPFPDFDQTKVAVCGGLGVTGVGEGATDVVGDGFGVTVG
jgi:hypothetical protein